MPSAKKQIQQSADDLLGLDVLVPRSTWPNEVPPPGQSGWLGKVTAIKQRRPEAFFLSFRDDPATYWFHGTDVRKWLQTTPGKQSAARKTQRPSTSDDVDQPLKAIPELFVSKEEKEYSEAMGEIITIAGQLTEASLHTLASKARRILNKQKLSGTKAVSTGGTRASDAN